MKDTLYYILREKPTVLMYFICLVFLLVSYPFSNTYITREFNTISKYSDHEIMIMYPDHEYKIYEQGEYTIHGNLITTEDESDNKFIPTWFFVQLTLLFINLFVLFQNGDLKRNKIKNYFATRNVYVDLPREVAGNYKYIYDGKLIYEYIILLHCSSTLEEALEKYFKNPDQYEDYV